MPASERAASYGRKIYVWSTVKANALYAEKLYHYIVDNRYDTVVMPHLFPAEALTYMLRRHERRPDIHTYFVGTDYTCIPFTEETEVDYYFIADEELMEEYVQRGIPREKLIPTGIPVSDRFQHPAPYQKDEDYFSAAGAELAVYGLCHWIPRQICGGILLLSDIVAHKNSLRQQALEEQHPADFSIYSKQRSEQTIRTLHDICGIIIKRD